MSHGRVAPLLLLLTSLTACSDEPGTCELGDPHACDVREAACIERLNALIVCMRGVDHPVPDYVVPPPEEVLATLPAPERPAADEAARLAFYYDGLKLLHLLPPYWAPSYDRATSLPEPFINVQEDGRLRIVVDGSLPENEVRALLYTLTFMHRSAETDVDALWAASESSFDQQHAVATLLTGESFFYANLAFAWRGDPAVARNFDFRGGLELARATMADPEATHWEAMTAFDAYFGAYRAHHDFVAGGPEAIDAGYEERLGSTAHALAGVQVAIDAVFSAIDTELPEPPPGFEYLYNNQLGPVAYHMHRIRAAGEASSPFAEESLARAWVGDRILFTGNAETGQLAVVWQIADTDGTVGETIVAASDPETEASFRALFP